MMGLCDYGSSASEPAEEAEGSTRAPSPKKRRRRKRSEAPSESHPDALSRRKKRPPPTQPPPPPALARADERVDDGGRVRAEPHRVGMWSGMVYLEPADASQGAALLGLLPAAAAATAAKGRSAGEWKAVPSAHVSLSRQLYLHKDEVSRVAAALEAALGNARFPAFEASFGDAATLANDEGTTEFLAAATRSAHVAELVALCDGALRGLGLPAYYAEPVLHATLATRPAAEEDELSTGGGGSGGVRGEGVGGGGKRRAGGCRALAPLSTPVSVVFSAAAFRAGNRHFRFAFDTEAL